MVEEKVTILAVLKDRFTGPLKKLSTGIGKIFSLFTGLTKIITAPFTLLASGLSGLFKAIFSLQGLLIGGGAAGIIAVFGRFEEQMIQVATLVDTTAVSIGKLGDELIRISIDSGDNLASLTKGLFDLISAGVAAGQATETLAAAAKLAAAGGTTTAEAVDGLTTVLNAYGLSADRASEVTDSFFKAMEGGKTTIGEMARGIGIVAKTANVVGLTIDELTGSIAALTKGGLSTRLAIGALNSLLQSILSPSESARKAAQEMGLEMSTTALRAKGLVEFLREISEATGDVDTELNKLFPNQRAFRAALILSGNEAKVFAEQMGLMAEKAGATDIAFEKVASGLFFKLRQVKNLFLAILITIGEAAKPFIEDIIGEPGSGKGLTGFLETLLNSKGQIQTVVVGIAESIKLLGNVIRTAFNQGDFFTLLTNVVSQGIKLVLRLILEAIPTVIATAKLIGGVFAEAVIRSFLASSTTELTRVLSANKGIGAILQLTKVITETERLELEKLGADLRRIEGEIKTAVDDLKRVRDRGAVPLGAGDPLAGDQAALEQRQEKFIARTEARIAQLRLQREKLLLESEGIDVFEQSFERQIDAVAKASVGLAEAAQVALAEAIAAIPEGLKDPTKDAIDSLLQFIKVTLPQSFASAGINDDMARAAREALEAAKGEVDDAIDEEDAIGPGPEDVARLSEFEQGLKDVISQFDTMRQVGSAAGAALTAGISGLIDVFLSAERNWKQFAESFLKLIAKMILQMAIFRALSGILGGSSTPPDLPQSPLSAGNVGAYVSRRGLTKLNIGDFVPGRRGPNRDTIPALLTVGEAVTRRPSVDFYGRGLFSALNAKLIPRSAVAQLMASIGGSSAAMVRRRFQSGGIAGAATGPNPIIGPTVLPILQVNDDNVEAMLADGAQGAFRFFGDNREMMLSALGLKSQDSV